MSCVKKLYPKPFMKMPNGFSILQNTFIKGISNEPKSIINITNGNFLEKIQKELCDLAYTSDQQPKVNYILEPFGKNTVAAIAMACLLIIDQYEVNETLLVLPSNHFISKQQEFNEIVSIAQGFAKHGRTVTFGIKLNSPETGYGYREFEGNMVKDFVEKPSIENAELYLESEKYLWNSGMFCF